MRTRLAIPAALVFALAACGNGDQQNIAADISAPRVTAPTPSPGGSAALTPATHEPTTTERVAEPVPERPKAPLETQRVELSWQAPDGESWQLDVVAPIPAAEGGWPVLVTFHGAARGTSATVMSAAAKSGIVVVAPRWIDPEWSVSNLNVMSSSVYVDGAAFDVARCALGAAQQAAGDYGGNPERTTVEGFSAGVHPAAWVGLGVVRDDPCPDVVTAAPIAMVLGDSQWVFQIDVWDDTFVDSTSRAADTVDRFLNPDRWTVPDEFVAYLWSTESSSTSRPVQNPPSEESWLRTRGGDDIVKDLDAIGAFDDESIGFLDNGRLQELRIQRTDIHVSHEEYPGGHDRKPEMIDKVIDLIWAQVAEDR